MSGVALDRDGILALVPHLGAMCLWDEVVSWDGGGIALRARNHADPRHPLRDGAGLRGLHLCEYGAQAMAVHGGLRGTVTGVKPKPGMLVSLRAVKLTCEYVEDLPGDLRVEAECLQADAASLQYSFRVRHGATLLAEGRAAVVLG
jgi:predicted hotdog family 3-hydroxylacyl-ACP dehydratase